jgi:hypothetical protein
MKMRVDIVYISSIVVSIIIFSVPWKVKSHPGRPLLKLINLDTAHQNK